MQIFKQYNMEVFNVERVSSHGGSIRVYACHQGKYAISNSVKDLVEIEEAKKLSSYETLEKFANRVKENKEDLINLLKSLKSQGKKIVGISAPARSSTILNYCGINSQMLDYIAEKGELKIGKYTPGTHIKVEDDDFLVQEQPDYALLLSWHLKDSMISKIKKDGYEGKFIIPLPKVEVI